MLSTIWTAHALDRVSNRLASVITSRQVSEKLIAVNARLRPGRNNVLVRALPHRVELVDPDVVPDGIAKGDWVVALVDVIGEYAQVTTVILRKSSSQSPAYAVVIK